MATTTISEYWGHPLGFVQMTSLSAAVALTSIPAGAQVAVITVETQSVRYRDDGTAPTAGVGILLPTASAPFVYRGNLALVQVIETTGSGKINVAYYGVKPSLN